MRICRLSRGIPETLNHSSFDKECDQVQWNRSFFSQITSYSSKVKRGNEADWLEKSRRNP